MKNVQFFEHGKHFLWCIPFISFLGGYYFFALLYGNQTFETPSLIGSTLEDAFGVLSHHKLNPRLLATKEAPDLPVGTILHQNPAPKTKIKPHQTIFLVTSVQQKQMHAPQLSGLMADALTASLKTLGIRPNLYYMPSNYPKDYCIAQFPEADQPLKGTTMVVYISSGTTKPVLLPNFKGKLVGDVQDFLHTHQLHTIITHAQPQEPDHTCSTRCRVRDQRPLAGSLLNLDQQKPLTVHVQVTNNS